MERVIEHSGVVERVVADTVFVRIIAAGACGGCRAREACGMSEAQEKIMGVPTVQAGDYVAGEQVVVGVNRRAGWVAIFWGYIMALVVLVGALIAGLYLFGWSEGASLLFSLSGLALYYGALWLCRNKIETNIHFTISKP